MQRKHGGERSEGRGGGLRQRSSPAAQRRGEGAGGDRINATEEPGLRGERVTLHTRGDGNEPTRGGVGCRVR